MHCLYFGHSMGLLAASCLTWRLALVLWAPAVADYAFVECAGAPKALAAPPSLGVFLLLVLNLAAFVADHLLHLPFMPLLYLNHQAPHW